jgi:hypothetical protein
MQNQLARGFDLHRHLGQAELHALVIKNRGAEALMLLGVPNLVTTVLLNSASPNHSCRPCKMTL